MQTVKNTRSAWAMVAPLTMAMVLVSMIALCQAGCSSKPTPHGQYTNKKEGFTITAPVSWEKAENKMGMTVVFLEPRSDPSDTFRENVNVVVEKLPTGINLDRYVKVSNENMLKLMTDYSEASSERVKLGENDAQRIVYQHRMGVFNLKCLLYLVVRNGRGYVLTCTARDDEYENHEATFEKTCKTFKIQ